MLISKCGKCGNLVECVNVDGERICEACVSVLLTSAIGSLTILTDRVKHDKALIAILESRLAKSDKAVSKISGVVKNALKAGSKAPALALEISEIVNDFNECEKCERK